jgi:hypothetical protein
VDNRERSLFYVVHASLQEAADEESRADDDYDGLNMGTTHRSNKHTLSSIR